MLDLMTPSSEKQQSPWPWRKRPVLWRMALVVLAVAGALLGWRLSEPEPAPLEISLWYWHQPFRLTASETAQLRSAGIHSLFVRSGTFQRDGQGVRLVLPQTWVGRCEGVGVHLVFHFDYD